MKIETPIFFMTIAVFAISGCSGNYTKMQEQVEFAANNFAGFPVENLKDCAGLPHTKQQSKNYEVYVYRTEASGVMGNYGQCEMQFYIAEGVVKQVSYNGSNPTGMLEGSEFCAPIVSQCLVDYFGQEDPGTETQVKFNKIQNL